MTGQSSPRDVDSSEAFIRRTTSPAGAQAHTKHIARDHGYRKAAVLLLLIGKDQAAKILAHLTPKEVEGITVQIARVTSVGKREADQVLEEFGYLTQAGKTTITGGHAKATQMLTAAFGEEKAERLAAKLPTTPAPFSFLTELDVEQVAVLLQEESGPVCSLILAHLPPATAAGVLSRMPQDLRPEVARRLAKMASVDPAVIVQTEAALREKIRTQGTIVTAQIDGPEILAQMLRHLPAGHQEDLLQTLEQADPATARDVRRRRFGPESLREIAPRDLQRLLREQADQDLAMLLKALPADLSSVVLDNVSAARGRLLAAEPISAWPEAQVASVLERFLALVAQQVGSSEIRLTPPDEVAQ